jgi:hypothetical protein
MTDKLELITYPRLQSEAPLLAWFLAEGSGNLTKETVAEIVKRTTESEGGFKFQLLVNGIELPAFESFKEIDKQMNRMINTEARKRICEFFAHEVEEFDLLLDEFKLKILQRYNDVQEGVDPDER